MMARPDRKLVVEDASRIAECVNACAGIDPEAIRELIEAAEAALDGPIAVVAPNGVCCEDRDNLRAALRAVKGEK